MTLPVSDLASAPLANDTPSAAGQLRLLEASFARLRLGMSAMPLTGLIFGVLMNAQDGPGARMFWWGGAYVLALLLVWWGHQRYRQQRTHEPPEVMLRIWYGRVCWLALAHGLGMSLSVALSLDHAHYEYMLMLHVALLGILTANAAQMTAVLRVYQMFMAGAVSGLVVGPFAFPTIWPFLFPMTLIMSFVIYRSGVKAHGFLVRQVLLEERSRDLAERYRAASSAALEALAEKNHFLGAAAHDLRQPVHAMALLAEAIALHGQHVAGLAPLLQQWRQSMRSVNHMFNTLLDLSRIESGTMKARPTTVSIAQLLDEVGLQFGEDARARGLVLRLRPAPPEALLWTDPALVRQALFNLVHNALRYTPHGGVLVAARRRAGRWRIGVWDTGTGMAEQEQTRIFEAFYRGAGAHAAVPGGHGLGLAVVARCVALMDARQGVRSHPGRGSYFWLELPAATAKQATSVPSCTYQTPPPSPRLRGNCLVVDDEPQVLQAWSALLGSWGLHLRTATGLQQAWAQLDAGFVPDVILCDEHLGHGERGFAVLQALLERCPAARGAMVSGEFDTPSLQDALGEGYLVLHKPVDPETLHDMLSRWLDGNQNAT